MVLKKGDNSNSDGVKVPRYVTKELCCNDRANPSDKKDNGCYEAGLEYKREEI